MEKDDEVKGINNSLDYGTRIFDPRVGRFFSIDALTKKFPELTPYQFASNRPIDGIDIDGMEHITYRVTLSDQGKVKQVVETSKNLKDKGQKGWGKQYSFYDEKGNKVFQYFKESDPPVIWTGADRPFYIAGRKILGRYDEYEGSHGFKNGGYQTGLATIGLFFGVSDLFLRKLPSRSSGELHQLL